MRSMLQSYLKSSPDPLQVPAEYFSNYNPPNPVPEPQSPVKTLSNKETKKAAKEAAKSLGFAYEGKHSDLENAMLAMFAEIKTLKKDRDDSIATMTLFHDTLMDIQASLKPSTTVSSPVNSQISRDQLPPPPPPPVTSPTPLPNCIPPTPITHTYLNSGIHPQHPHAHSINTLDTAPLEHPPKHSLNLTLVSNIPLFAGAFDDLGVQRLFDQLENAAALSNWSEADMLAVLQMRITGAAKMYFDTYKLKKHRYTYTDVKQDFLKRFQTQEKPHTILKQLTHFQAKNNEPLNGTIDHINNLVAKLSLAASENPQETFSMIIDHLALESFLNNLPPKLRDMIRARTPKMYNEAVELASSYQDIGLIPPDPDPASPQSIFRTEISSTSPQSYRDMLRPQPLFPKIQPSLPQSPRKKSVSFNPPTPSLPKCRYCPQYHWHSDCSQFRKTRHERSSLSRYNRNSITSNSSGNRPPRSSNYSSPASSRSSSPSRSYSYRRKPPTCQLCHFIGHTADKCDSYNTSSNPHYHTPNTNNSQQFNKSQLQPLICKICNKEGHTGFHCDRLNDILN